MGYHFTINRNDKLTHNTMWMNYDMLCSEKEASHERLSDSVYTEHLAQANLQRQPSKSAFF
jgi:hypothetical protein